MAQAGLICGFVPVTNDEGASQLIVDTDAAAELHDSPYLQETLRSESHTYYRLTGFGQSPTEDGATCPECEGCDVSECLLSTFSFLPVDPYKYRWCDSELCLWFAFRNRAELETTVESLREAGYTIDLRQLSRDDSDFTPSNAIVDVAVLTPRQREAISLAIERDYFGPDGATVDQLAAELDVSTSTFSKHVRVGVQKLIDQMPGV